MIFVNEDPLADTNQNESQSGDDDEEGQTTDAEINLQAFWPGVMDEIKKIKNVDAKNQNLPLARIKKIMKLDEDVKMISAEAPLLFAKAAEIFIHELTLRAWVHTEDNKRRTLQKNDIAMAITKYDQFDFLIDIVPRDEIKPKKEQETTKTVLNCDQGQYYFQIAQPQQQQQNQGNTSGIIQTQQNQMQQQQQHQPHIQLLHNTTTIPQQQHQQQVTMTSPQNIIVANQNQQMLVNNMQQQQQPQQLQLVQQIVSPTGEITHVPIPLTAQQLNMLRLQMQGNANQQPIIIQQQQQQVVSPQQSTHIYQNQQTSQDD